MMIAAVTIAYMIFKAMMMVLMAARMTQSARRSRQDVVRRVLVIVVVDFCRVTVAVVGTYSSGCLQDPPPAV